jgi:deazaflavin-dependent oxidoreductase (nitroreductase family)
VSDLERLEGNRVVAEAFRTHGGRLEDGPLAGMSLLLLHTVGARSGKPRMSPLRYHPDGDRWVVFAANGGRPTRPGWYHNLVARPDAEIEVGTERVAVVATVAEGSERSRLWADGTVGAAFLEDFQRTAPGPIPVVVLTRRTG